MRCQYINNYKPSFSNLTNMGTTGCTGSLGITGATGATGITGYCGIEGDIGITGSPGDTGCTGILGSIGASGSTGNQGNTGPQSLQLAYNDNNVIFLDISGTLPVYEQAGDTGDGIKEYLTIRQSNFDNIYSVNNTSNNVYNTGGYNLEIAGDLSSYAITFTGIDTPPLTGQSGGTFWVNTSGTGPSELWFTDNTGVSCPLRCDLPGGIIANPTPPLNPSAGDMYYDTSLTNPDGGLLYYYDGVSWVNANLCEIRDHVDLNTWATVCDTQIPNALVIRDSNSGTLIAAFGQTIPNGLTGTRMLFNDSLGTLQAGSADAQWDPLNAGTFNATFGLNNLNSGTNTVVGGVSNVTDAVNGMVVGTTNSALCDRLVVGGTGNVCISQSTSDSVIVGENNVFASTNTAIGGSNNNIPFIAGNAMIAGYNNTLGAASSNFLLNGYQNDSTVNAGIVCGRLNTSSGSFSVTLGQLNSNTATSAVVGFGNTVQTNYSTVSGFNNFVNSTNSVVCGNLNSVSGQQNMVCGFGNTAASCINSAFCGNNNVGTTQRSVMLGDGNSATGNIQNSIICGENNTVTDMTHSVISGSNNNIFDNNVAIVDSCLICGNANTILTSIFGIVVLGENNLFTNTLKVVGIVCGNDNSMVVSAVGVIAGNSNSFFSNTAGVTVAGNSNVSLNQRNIFCGTNNESNQFNLVIGENDVAQITSSLIVGNNINATPVNNATFSATAHLGSNHTIITNAGTVTPIVNSGNGNFISTNARGIKLHGQLTRPTLFSAGAAPGNNFLSSNGNFVVGRGVVPPTVTGAGISFSASVNPAGTQPVGFLRTNSFNNNGADYAEMFEWEDGNIESETRYGRFVSLTSGEKISFAVDDNDVLGVTSKNPGVLGDTAKMGWQGTNLRDEFGDVLTMQSIYSSMIELLNPVGLLSIIDVNDTVDQTKLKALDEIEQIKQAYITKYLGNDPENEYNSYEDQLLITELGLTVDPKTQSYEQFIILLQDQISYLISNASVQNIAQVNPNYDPSIPYYPRQARKEWIAVGILGKVYVIDNGLCTVGGKCSCSNGYAVPGDKWFVLKRRSQNIIKILYKRLKI